jgi:hypothetical protein
MRSEFAFFASSQVGDKRGFGIQLPWLAKRAGWHAARRKQNSSRWFKHNFGPAVIARIEVLVSVGPSASFRRCEMICSGLARP